MAQRILHCVSAGAPTMRVRNAAEMAAGAGLTADVLTFAPAEPPEWEWGDAVHVGPSSHGERWRRRIRRRRSWPFPALDREFPHLEAFAEIVRRRQPDVVHWKDLAGAVAAGRVAKRQGARFVLDMHENYPYNMWSTERDTGDLDEIYNLNEWFRYEALAAHEADVLVVTIDEMGQRLVGMHGIAPEKVRIVHNTEPAWRWRGPRETRQLQERYRDRMVILYGGSCSPHRGLDTIIQALALLGDRPSRPKLVVVGDGPAVPGWRRLAADLGVGHEVEFAGWRSFEELQRYQAVAALGVVPHHKYGQTDNTVPHKLYQNMIGGIPTLVSSCHSLQRIIEQTGAGVVFAAGDPRSAADGLIRLEDPDLRQRTGALGRAAIDRAPFSWSASAEALLDAYGVA